MLRKRFLNLVLVVLLTGCAGSAQPATDITILATDFSYMPSSLTVPVGQPITLTITNNGKVEHDFVITKISLTDVVQPNGGTSMGHDMGAAEYDLHVSTQAGGTSVITFTPTEAGTYDIFCTIQGHKEAGMLGTLIVVASE